MTQPWTVGAAVDWTAGYLERQGIADARLEAEILLASVLECPRLQLVLRRGEAVPDGHLRTYRGLIEERRKRKPLSYLLGEHEFMGLRFKVSGHTLIPRPETELLVQEALGVARAGCGVLADIGTGSGCIAVSIGTLGPVSRIYATDVSLGALATAQENVDFHGMAGRIILKQGDLFDALRGENLEGKIDIIVSNPPYIPSAEIDGLAPELAFEPRHALDGGTDGLSFYRRLANDAKTYLRERGWILLELDDRKSPRIGELFTSAGYAVERTVRDYAGLERILVARRK